MTLKHLEGVVAVVAAATALGALWFSYQSDQRSRNAEERAIASEEFAKVAQKQLLANDVVFLAQPLTDPSSSKVITDVQVSVLNYGRLPIGNVRIEDTPVPFGERIGDVPGVTWGDGQTYNFVRIGIIGPCEGVSVRTTGEFLSDGFAIFEDANGTTWFRRQEEQPLVWEPHPENAHPMFGSLFPIERNPLDGCR